MRAPYGPRVTEESRECYNYVTEALVKCAARRSRYSTRQWFFQGLRNKWFWAHRLDRIYESADPVCRLVHLVRFMLAARFAGLDCRALGMVDFIAISAVFFVR
jgi:hypothetical protein